MACAGAKTADERENRTEPLGLFTTLPIFWAESEDLRGLLGDVPPHWVLGALRKHGEVRPIDSLMPEQAAKLDDIGLLVMAQPRALAAQENVTLDQWVRRGGRLLLFADPMLTEESTFGLGDRRRPQDVVLLSPILSHWGLELKYDEDQARGEKIVQLLGEDVPVNLPGHLEVTAGNRDCAVLGEGLAALCRIGRGQVLVVADASLLEKDRPAAPDGYPAALEKLLGALPQGR